MIASSLLLSRMRNNDVPDEKRSGGSEAILRRPIRLNRSSALKKIVTVTAIFFAGFAASPVRSQTHGTLLLSAFPFTPFCKLQDSPGIVTVYIFHGLTPGALGSRFKLASSSGVTMTYVSETINMPAYAGTTQTGISICYGGCTMGQFIIASVSYLAYGTGSPCGSLQIVPHPAAQTVDGISCTGSPELLEVQDMYVGPGMASCGCPSAHVFPGTPSTQSCGPVATSSSTWGAIKALYRN